MKDAFIVAIAAELYTGVLLFGYRREVAGVVLHHLGFCRCASWRRCEAVHRH